jgi:hypothetical protein
MAYKSSLEFYAGIKLFIIELEDAGKSEASKRMQECLKYIDKSSEEWKMFYKGLIFMKDEFGYKFNIDENKKMEEIIEAAKRVVNRL